MKNPRFNTKDWEMINAYAHGWAHGVSGLEMHHLWSYGEEGFKYEGMGWNDGLIHLQCCGSLDETAEPIDWNELDKEEV
jgi:hypothetical protein